MPPAARPLHTSATFALAIAFAASACKGQSPPPAAEGKGDGKSVMEGGKARSAPGRTLEDAKQRVDATEEQLQDRSDDMLERSAGEKVERGAP